MIAALAAFFAVATLVAPVSSHAGQVSASATREGWWAKTAVPVPPVPADALGVAAVAGDPDKIAAIAIELDVAKTATIDHLDLTLTEAPEAQATLNEHLAKVTACPATAAWTAVRGGPWEAAPAYNCSLANAEGFRTPEGIWTFDLTVMGRLWQGSLPRHGIVLVENVAAPVTFQLSFLGLTTKTPKIEVSASDGTAAPAATEPASGETAAGTSDTTPPDNSFEAIPELPAEPDAETARVVDPVDPLTPGDDTAAPTALSPAAAVSHQGRLAGNWSPIALLLVPLALAAAFVIARVLGPDGDPGAVRRRVGGVSRALDRRRKDPS